VQLEIAEAGEKPLPPHSARHKTPPDGWSTEENDPPRDTNWCGFGGNAPIGRIRKEMQGLTKGQWHWVEDWELSMRVMEPRAPQGRQS
jgi:hypothetical protein